MKNIFFFLSLFGGSICFAQNNFKGTLVNENNKPVPYANVILVSLPDSTMVKGAISNDKGVFELQNHSKSKKLAIKITHVEYKEKVISADNADLGTILLEQSFNELGEVVVSATKPIMQQQGSIISTNIAQSSLKDLPQLGMVINFLPGISKSFDGGGIQVFGKTNPVYYINNRKVRDMMDLYRISPKDIERIDIETEPGAEHDNSIGAIIRIILKKRKGDGLSGLVNIQSNFKRGTNVHSIIDLNYRSGRTDIFTTIAPEHNYGVVGENGSTFSIYTPLSNWRLETSEYQKNNSKSIYAKLGFAHEFSDKHSIGASVWTNINPYSGNVLTNQKTKTLQNQNIIRRGENHYDRFNQNKHIASNIYYEGKISDKIKLQTDFDYQGMRTDNNLAILERDLLAQSQRNVNANSDAKLNWAGIKTTLSQNIGKSELSYGFEGSSLSRSENYRDNLPTSSDIDNKESKAALFASYSFPWKKINLKAGLRYEYTDFEYFENNQKRDAQSRIYRNFLPNVSLSFPWDKTTWSFSYIKKIQRPAFYELSDYPSYSSPFLYNRGNPNLVPRLSDDVNLLVSYKNYSFAANYSYVKDGIYTLYAPSSLNPNVIEKTLRNFDDLQTLKLTLSAQHKVGIWIPKTTLALGKQFANGIFVKNDPIFSVNLQNQFLLSERLVGLLLMEYRSKGSIADTYYDNIKSDISLVGIYAIPKYTLQLFGGISDIFNTNKNNIVISNPYVTSRNYVINNNSRAVFIGFLYEFNKTNKKYKGQKHTEEEKSRL